MFKYDGGDKPCHLCAAGRVLTVLFLMSLTWVVVGVIARLCARLLSLGWNLV